MLRAGRLVVPLTAALALSLAPALAAAANDAPEYSPLPPPPPPPGEPAVRPSPRPLALPPAAAPVARAPAPQSAASSGAPGAPTTTTSASLDPADPDAPSSTASRAPTLDDERLGVAPLLGFASDGLDVGAGIRIGKTVLDHVWVGGTGIYHAGTSNAGVVGNVRYESSTSAFFVGGEVGYDFEVGPVVIRPYGGLGLAALSVSGSTAGVGASATATKLVIWPGATLLYGLPSSRFFVGGDTRLITIPGGPAFGLYAVGGLTL